MKLIECTLKDITLLQEIAERTYRDTFSRVNTVEDMDKYISEAFTPQKLEKEICNSASLFFFAVEDNKLVGYIKLNFAAAQTELQDDKALEIERIYLLNEFQGKGYGDFIIENVVRLALDQGKEYIWLGVWEHNSKALAFYKKNGFYQFGEHPFVLGSDVQTDLLMRKDVEHRGAVSTFEALFEAGIIEPT